MVKSLVAGDAASNNSDPDQMAPSSILLTIKVLLLILFILLA